MRRPLTLALSVVLVLAAACGDDENTAVGGPSTDADADPAVIAISLEETDGIFIEGFEVGLRFETGDGEVIDSTLWSEFVAASGDESLDAYYDSVLEQQVPAGPVVVLATVNVGMGPPPETPDLDGDLDCRLELDAEAGDRIEVEVTFDGTGECVRRL